MFYTHNNLLDFVHKSKFGICQIQWLSELALLDFVIKYRTGKSNKVANALCFQPLNPDSPIESDSDKNEVKAISYSSLCEIANWHLGTT